MEEPHIVVFGIGKRRQLMSYFREEAHKRGFGLIGCDASRSCVARAEVDHFKQVPRASSLEQYHDAVTRLFTEWHIAALTSIIDPELVPLAVLSERTCSGPTLLNCSSAIASICEDKLIFSRVLQENGIPSIPTFSEPVAPVPYISKDRRGSCGSGFRVHQEGDSAPSATVGDLIYQPFVDGAHYCVDAYFDLRQGKMRAICCKEVLEKRYGETYVAQTVVCDPFVPMISRIASVLALRGICNFDVYEYKGELAFMEVNARIGGNYPMSHQSSVNMIGLMLDDVLGADLPTMWSDYTPGVLFGKSIETVPFRIE